MRVIVCLGQFASDAALRMLAGGGARTVVAPGHGRQFVRAMLAQARALNGDGVSTKPSNTETVEVTGR